MLCIGLLSTGITALTQPKPVTDSTNYWIPEVTLEGNNSCIRWQPYSKHPGSELSSRAFLCGHGAKWQRHTDVPATSGAWLLFQGHIFSPLWSCQSWHTLSFSSFLLAGLWMLLAVTELSCSAPAHLLEGLWHWGTTCTSASCYTCVLLKTTAHWWAS